MNAKKWIAKDHKYVDYLLPKGCVLLAELEELVPCAQCGNTEIFGQMYTSMEVHTGVGLGYPVCSGCYQLEWERRRENA